MLVLLEVGELRLFVRKFFGWLGYRIYYDSDKICMEICTDARIVPKQHGLGRKFYYIIL